MDLRILILWNEGMLPDNLSIRQLKGKHPSRPRNQNIAQVFFRAGFIEAWGRGISKISSALLQAGLPKPDIEEHAGGLQLTLHRKKINVPENVPEKRVTIILDAIKKNASVSTKELAAVTRVSEKTIKRDLGKLKELRYVERIGSDKGGYWKINK